jgi:hypothetical protein
VWTSVGADTKPAEGFSGSNQTLIATLGRRRKHKKDATGSPYALYANIKNISFDTGPVEDAKFKLKA